MILNNEISVKVVGKTLQYYKNKGYDQAAVKSTILVKVDDLPLGSNVEVICKCDECGNEFKQRYCRNTDICGKCRILKHTIGNTHGKSNKGKKYPHRTGKNHHAYNENRTKFERYEYSVRYYTKQNVNVPENKVVSYKKSIRECFNDNVSIELAGSNDNVLFVTYKEVAVKRAKNVDYEKRNEITKTNLLKKHGVKNVSQIPEVKAKISTSLKNSLYEKAVKKLPIPLNEINFQKLYDDWLLSPDKISTYIGNKYGWENQSFLIMQMKNLGFNLTVKNSGRSEAEESLARFIETNYNTPVIRNTRSVLTPMEIDIWLPERNVGIEYHGSYWHSRCDKLSHQKKYLLAREKGISLLQFFDFECEEKEQIVHDIISNKIGAAENKIGARECKIIKLSKNDVDDFMEVNHLQGKAISSVRLGLDYNDKTVCAMTFAKSRFNKLYEWELIRYASKNGFSVIGGASKLLTHFEKTYNPNSIISYANARISNGNLYNKLGFGYIRLSEPNYWYLKKNIRINRIGAQKHKLQNLLGEDFDPKLSELDNMLKAGFDVLYDAGNTSWSKNYK